MENKRREIKLFITNEGKSEREKQKPKAKIAMRKQEEKIKWTHIVEHLHQVQNFIMHSN